MTPEPRKRKRNPKIHEVLSLVISLNMQMKRMQEDIVAIRRFAETAIDATRRLDYMVPELTGNARDVRASIDALRADFGKSPVPIKPVEQEDVSPWERMFQ